MKRSRGAATSARTPAAARAAGTRLSAGGAFVLNACFVAGLLVLSQLPLLQQRPTVRASIVAAALFLLAWSGLLFGVLRRGQKVALEIVLRRQHYLQACLQGTLILYWGYYWREVYHAAPLIAAQLLLPTASTACSGVRTGAPSCSAPGSRARAALRARLRAGLAWHLRDSIASEILIVDCSCPKR